MMEVSSSSDDSLLIGIDGGAPFGFRLFGGDGRPLVVAKLRKRSKAWDAGLEEGDALVSINDHPCHNISHAAAMNLVDKAGHYLNLKVIRKGWVPGQLHVTRGGSRQRSLTPSTVLPPVQFTTYPSPEPPRVSTTQSVQWSSRATTKVNELTGNSLQQQTRTFQIHLSEPETGPDDDDAWNRPSSKPGFLRGGGGAKEQSRSPSNGPLSLFSEAVPPPLPQQSRPSGAQNKSPAVWKPPSWQPEATEPTRSSFSQEFSATRFNASAQSNNTRENAQTAPWKPPSWQTEPPRTTFFQDNQAVTPIHNWKTSKENVPPAVNRNNPSLPINQVEVAKHKPDVWQPSTALPPARKVSFPGPSLSPGMEFDLSDGGGVGGRREGGSGWKQKTTKNEDVSSWDGLGKTPFHEMPPHLNKILTAANVDDEDEFGSILHDTADKKHVYVDSSFYHDPAHKYPTVDEQIKMARQVAMSLTAPSNAKARGHRMFMKRKEKSDKWVVDTAGLERSNIRSGGMSDSEADIYYNPTPWNAAGSSWKAPQGGGAVFPRDVAAPPPLPTSKLFAPKLNPDEDSTGERAKALSAEEFERLRLYSQKTTHNMINPQICFTLAEDLRQSKGKGGRMFAKRRAKSEEWAVEGNPSAPDPKLMQKISGGFAAPAAGREKAPTPVNNGPRNDEAELPPLNRLKEMIELPKAKITPWDAVAEYGNVDLAFEHLDGISFLRPKVGSPYADSVATSLQQATTRRRSDLTSSRPTAPTKGPPPGLLSPSPTWNRPTELTTNNRLSNKMAPNSPSFVGSSPSSYGSGSGYRPVGFLSSSENTRVSAGFSDL